MPMETDKKTGESIFQRTALLIGEEALERLQSKRVIIFGVGGVGSWCAESLVRSGIRQLTIVDSDIVCASNINRQLMATTTTIGQAKVDVLCRRLLDINPSAEITPLRQRFNDETAASFGLTEYDYIIDAIDSLRDKMLLIEMACDAPGLLFSSMGAARKMNPARIQVGEFWQVQGDPLARTLRKRFKQQGRLPSRKFQCVFSDELLPNKGTPCDTSNGTLAHITAIFGFTLAGLVVRDAVTRGAENS